MCTTDPRSGYAEVNGLRMYYEIHGDGPPLLLLHGAFMTIDTMGAILPGLAKIRQVIAVEAQGHGHTGDIARPITYEQMADDAATLLRHLDIDIADVFGFSMGGGVGATFRGCRSHSSRCFPAPHISCRRGPGFSIARTGCSRSSRPSSTGSR